MIRGQVSTKSRAEGPVNEELDGRGYASHGHCSEALQLLQQMQQEGPQPNNRTWTAILAGYSQQGYDKDASHLFQQMSYEGLEPNVVTWNALISGYVLHGQSQEALNVFYEMVWSGSTPDKVTYVSILKACANVLDLDQGKLIHNQLINGEESSLAVETTLIDMYAKCGSVEDAQNMFDNLLNRDIAAWNSLIAGYVLHGFLLEALRVFQQMQKEGIMPDNTTLLSIVKVCALISAPISGKLIHGITVEIGIDGDEFILSSLIDMYAQCGRFKDACRVFDRMSKIDLAGWNALVAGYADQTEYPSVYQLLEIMKAKGLVPDGVTFVSLLSACSSSGSISDGANLFNSMTEIYNISPTNEHYGCMVDILGGAGFLIEAEDLLHVVPFQPMIVPWTSLLNSCRVYNDVELAEHCFEYVMDIDEGCASAYTLMSIIYCTAGMTDDLGKMKALRQQSNAWKKPGRAYIETDGVVHGFVVGDSLHAQNDAIYEKLGFLSMQLVEEGHVWQF